MIVFSNLEDHKCTVLLNNIIQLTFTNGKLWIQNKTVAFMPVTMARIVQLQEKLVTTKIDDVFMCTSHEG